jgi:small subunit ribosomal protein S16
MSRFVSDAGCAWCLEFHSKCCGYVVIGRRIARFAFEGLAMVVIRLSRGGAKKRPFFNMVVADSRDPRDGRFIERVGFYNPKAPAGQESLRIQMDRLTYWQGKGAKLSDTAARLVRQFGQSKPS